MFSLCFFIEMSFHALDSLSLMIPATQISSFTGNEANKFSHTERGALVPLLEKS